MADNIPKNEYDQKLKNQKQLQTTLIEASKKRREEEAQTEEEFFEEDEYLNEEAPLQQYNQYLEPKRKQRISRIMGVMLITSAILVDIVELIMTDTGLYVFAFGIFSFLISICATVIFAIWFQMLDISYSSNTKSFAKRFWTSIVACIAEIAPGLDWLQVWFVWTLGMVVVVGMVRMEDKGEEPSILGGLSEGIALLATSNPLNPAGIPGGIALSIVNKARRSIKSRVGVGQAEWKKEQEQRKIS